MNHQPTCETQLKELARQEIGKRYFTRAWEGKITLIFAVAWSIFQLYATWVGTLDSIQIGSIHLAFALALAFLAYPANLKSQNYVPWYDWFLLAIGISSSLYVYFEYFAITGIRGGLPNTLDLYCGLATLIVTFISVIRVAGPALLIIATLTILYGIIGPGGLIPWQLPDVLYLHNGYSWEEIIQQLYLTTEGLWGAPLRVSATFVFLFVLFGALLDRAGAGQYFINLSYSLLGGYRGGPAKAAVIGSLLTGVVSGSSISNVVTTGTFTIPIMKKIGFPASKASAVEVAASVNGQLMPPVMGAAAFIMADYLGIPYHELIIYALVPALLSYIGLFYMVHLEARKLGLEPLPKSELPPFWPTFLSGIHFLVPIGYLFYALVIKQQTPEFSAFYATLILIGILVIKEIWQGLVLEQSVWLGIKNAFFALIEGFEKGARNMVAIAIATAVAGVVIGMITMTGLGFGLTEIVNAISGGNLYLVLLLTALVSLILGMGLPTTANYIIMASLVAPVIFELGNAAGFTIPLLAIHMFVFYFGILADATPPVGLATYAGAAIAGSDPIKTGVISTIYNLRTAILPFLFILNPQLLLIDVTTLAEFLYIAVPATIGMLTFVAATQGLLVERLNWIERLVLLIASFVLIKPGVASDLIGVGLIAVIYLSQFWRYHYGLFKLKR